jgi:cell division protein FtsB
MSTQTCTEHGEDVVVFQGVRNSLCPLCEANTTIEDLKQKVEDLEGERDSLDSEIASLKEDLG